MRRLPVYFLVDVSESMVGDPIAQVEEGMRTIIQELRTDPYALETVFVSILAFAGKPLVLSPLTELYKFYPPAFPIGGGTALGEALRTLMRKMDASVQKTTLEAKGDWKPLVFLFTDGVPTDRPEAAIKEWTAKYRKQCNLVAISLGDNADLHLLQQLTDNVLRLNRTTPESFRQFFKWVTASIKTTSVSVVDAGKDELQLAPSVGIDLEKVEAAPPGKVDENFVVLLAKCSGTHQPYLIKYARRLYGEEDDIRREEMPTGNGIFRLVGAYPINEEMYKKLSESGTPRQNICTDQLFGHPACPCCGNQISVVLCSCGSISCAGEIMHTCPWCGTSGELGSANTLNLTRQRG